MQGRAAWAKPGADDLGCVERAQQSEHLPRIGALMPFTVDDPESLARFKTFAQGRQ